VKRCSTLLDSRQDDPIITNYLNDNGDIIGDQVSLLIGRVTHRMLMVLVHCMGTRLTHMRLCVVQYATPKNKRASSLRARSCSKERDRHKEEPSHTWCYAGEPNVRRRDEQGITLPE